MHSNVAHSDAHFLKAFAKNLLAGTAILALAASGALADSIVTGYQEITSVNQLGSGVISIQDGGHLRVLDTGTLAGPVAFVDGASTTLSTDGTLTVNVSQIGQGTAVNLGLAGQGGTIILNNFGAIGLSPPGTLSVNGGTTFVNTFQAAGSLGVLQSINVASGAILDYGVRDSVTVRGLGGAGLIGGAIDDMTVNGGSFSGTIASASNLHFQGTTVWSGTVQDLGRIIVESGADLTISGGTIFEDITALEVEGALNMQASETMGSLSGVGTIAVTTGETLTSGADNGSSTWSGTISGDAGFTKVGTGTMIFDGENYYEGTTTIAGGTLVISGGLAIADRSAVTINSGATLQVNNSENVGAFSGFGAAVLNSSILAVNSDNSTSTFSGNISGSGLLWKRGTGTLTLTGNNTNTGGVEVLGGTLVLLGGNAMANSASLNLNGGDAELQTSETIGSLLGSGDIDINANTLTLAGSAVNTYSGSISGTGTFALAGSGTMTLTGDSSGFAGSTTVTGSRLVVNGQLGGAATIGAGGTLAGTGTVGSGVGSVLTLASGSTLAAGNSIGTINVNGALVFNNGSRLEVEVDPMGTSSDLVAVTGAVTINGGSVVHVGMSGNYRPTQTYTILTASQGVSGTFDPSSVTSDFAFLDARLGYGANDITLTLERNDISFAAVGRTPNQASAAEGVEDLGFGNAIFDSVVTLDATTAASAFDQLSGEIHASTLTSMIEDGRFIRNTANERMRTAFEREEAPGVPVMAYGPSDAILPKADTSNTSAFWMTGFGGAGDTESDRNAAAMERYRYGTIAGADGMVGDWQLGILGGYGRSEISVDDRASSETRDDYHLGVYGGTEWGPVAFRTGLAHTWSEISTNRAVSFAGFFDELTADYNGRTLQAFGEIGYTFQIDSARIEPFVNVAHVTAHTAGFTESGGPAALSVAGGTTDTTFTTFGMRAETDFMMGDMRASMKGMAAWQEAFGDKTPATSNTLDGSDAFSIAGVPVASGSAILEAGLDVEMAPDSTFGLSVLGQFGSGTRDLGLKASLAVSF